MTLHLLRKSSASNSDTFGRYAIRKLRGTFPIVILIEQAEANNIHPVSQLLAYQQKVQSLLSRFCIRSSRLSPSDFGAPPPSSYGNGTP